MPPASSYDLIVVGAGSAGCAVAAGLAVQGMGRIAVIEAGPSDAHPLVKMPFGLVWLMGSKRDWRYRSTEMTGIKGRQIEIPRGRTVGGSGSINSMVWFRGSAADFDTWDMPGWAWSDVAPAFEEVEAKMTPTQMLGAHPLTRALGGTFGNDPDAAPTPERESAGVFRHNMRGGRRWSPADAFLRSALAKGVESVTGETLEATRGVVLSAVAIGSPEVLLNSGIGPAEDLSAAGITVALDVPGVGANLHDHPVGTLAMGGPVTSRLAFKGIDTVWIADASVMPAITSANTNAPSIMIGHRAAEFIAKDAA